MWQQWNPSWRHQDMRRNGERDDKIDLQRSDEARVLHTENMENNTYKSDLQKGNVEISVIIDRFALCQLYKLFSTLYTADFTTDLTVRNQRTRKGFDVHTKTLDHLAPYSLLEQKCREWCIKMRVATVDFMKAFDSRNQQFPWKALKKCGIESQYISFLRRLFRVQKGTVFTDKEDDMFEMKRHWKDDVTHWQKTNGFGISLGDSAFCWRALVLYIAGAAPKNHVRLQAEYVVCGIENSPGQDENSQQPKFKQMKISGDQQLWSWDVICLRARVRNILGKQWRFSNSKQQRSKIESEPPEHRFTDTNKSWHQNRTSCSTDSAYSTWWSRRRWVTPLALGHFQGNTNEWYDRLNARCFASSSKQKEKVKK